MRADADIDCVVGSGPAGVACASARLDRGRRVLMLDGGLSLEPERLGLVQKLRDLPRESWSVADLAAYQAGMQGDSAGLPQKLVYGSDFAYRDADEHLGVEYSNVGLRPSLAQGGLSNVWGAAMMPFVQRDLTEWPLGVAALAPHYSAVLRLTGLAATRDALAERFPLYTEQLVDLQPSGQALQLLMRMEKNRTALTRSGIHFGRSRLAVRGAAAAGEEGCRYCRLCMYGCPYDLIYSSTMTLNQLRQHPNFSYQPGVVVTSTREQGGAALISGYDRATRAPLEWQVDRVFLAGGTISTSGILLRSLAAYDQTVWMKDSQYFLLPLMLFRKVAGATREWLHALSQIFLELSDPPHEGKTTHIQIYSNNDLISQAIAKAVGPLRGPLGFLVANLQERLLIAQGFLHSEHSSRISVRLKASPHPGKDRLELRAEINPQAKTEVWRIVKKLFRHARHLGAAPLLPMLKIAEPGRSFHAGGTFPMSEQPAGFQTDLLGRPPAWKRVHAVDATIFPSIPATTITLSVMANAHRIGVEAPGAESS